MLAGVLHTAQHGWDWPRTVNGGRTVDDGWAARLTDPSTAQGRGRRFSAVCAGEKYG